MLKLIPVSINDIESFDNSEYGNLTYEDRIKLIKSSQEDSFNGKYFKFYVVKLENKIIGFINVCAHTENVVSIAPEIKEDFRRKGFGYFAYESALKLIKDKGFKIAISDVKIENVASYKLQEKLGFEHIKTYTNDKGNRVKFYVKSL